MQWHILLVNYWKFIIKCCIWVYWRTEIESESMCWHWLNAMRGQQGWNHWLTVWLSLDVPTCHTSARKIRHTQSTSDAFMSTSIALKLYFKCTKNVMFRSENMLLQYILVHAVTVFHIYLIVYICFISAFTEKSQNEGKETRERGSHTCTRKANKQSAEWCLVLNYMHASVLMEAECIILNKAVPHNTEVRLWAIWK